MGKNSWQDMVKYGSQNDSELSYGAPATSSLKNIASEQMGESFNTSSM